MRPQTRLLVLTFAFALLVAAALSDARAQPGGKKGGGRGAPETAADFVNRLMAFDKDKSGKLTKENVTDPRLHALLVRADANKDGAVTREELEALYAREAGDAGGGGFGQKG